MVIKQTDGFKLRKNINIRLILLLLNRDRKRKGSKGFIQLVLMKTQGTVMSIYAIFMMLDTMI